MGSWGLQGARGFQGAPGVLGAPEVLGPWAILGAPGILGARGVLGSGVLGVWGLQGPGSGHLANFRRQPEFAPALLGS